MPKMRLTPALPAAFLVFLLYFPSGVFAAGTESGDKKTAAEFVGALFVENDFRKAERLSAIPAMPTAVDLERNYREDFVAKFRDGPYKKIGRLEKRLFKTAVDENAFSDISGFLWATVIFSDHVIGREGDLNVFNWMATVKVKIKNGKVVRMIVDIDSLDRGCVADHSAPASP
ncbi:MAG: hypothetical protein HZA37_02345 [Parcubacteria group bacterium]|nr:hypothetical protein [Parcubacteria group bacterium]